MLLHSFLADLEQAPRRKQPEDLHRVRHVLESYVGRLGPEVAEWPSLACDRPMQQTTSKPSRDATGSESTTEWPALQPLGSQDTTSKPTRMASTAPPQERTSHSQAQASFETASEAAIVGTHPPVHIGHDDKSHQRMADDGALAFADMRGEEPVAGSEHHQRESVHFQIDHVFDVTSVGTVVSGTAVRGSVEVGVTYWWGPNGAGGEFTRVKVTSIHRSQVPVVRVSAGQCATLALDVTLAAMQPPPLSFSGPPNTAGFRNAQDGGASWRLPVVGSLCERSHANIADHAAGKPSSACEGTAGAAAPSLASRAGEAEGEGAVELSRASAASASKAKAMMYDLLTTDASGAEVEAAVELSRAPPASLSECAVEAEDPVGPLLACLPQPTQDERAASHMEAPVELSPAWLPQVNPQGRVVVEADAAVELSDISPEQRAESQLQRKAAFSVAVLGRSDTVPGSESSYQQLTAHDSPQMGGPRLCTLAGAQEPLLQRLEYRGGAMFQRNLRGSATVPQINSLSCRKAGSATEDASAERGNAALSSQQAAACTDSVDVKAASATRQGADNFSGTTLGCRGTEATCRRIESRSCAQLGIDRRSGTQLQHSGPSADEEVTSLGSQSLLARPSSDAQLAKTDSKSQHPKSRDGRDPLHASPGVNQLTSQQDPLNAVSARPQSVESSEAIRVIPGVIQPASPRLLPSLGSLHLQPPLSSAALARLSETVPALSSSPEPMSVDAAWQDMGLGLAGLPSSACEPLPSKTRRGNVLIDISAQPRTTHTFRALMVLTNSHWPPRGLRTGRWPPDDCAASPREAVGGGGRGGRFLRSSSSPRCHGHNAEPCSSTSGSAPQWVAWHGRLRPPPARLPAYLHIIHCASVRQEVRVLEMQELQHDFEEAGFEVRGVNLTAAAAASAVLLRHDETGSEVVGGEGALVEVTFQFTTRAEWLAPGMRFVTRAQHMSAGHVSAVGVIVSVGDEGEQDSRSHAGLATDGF